MESTKEYTLLNGVKMPYIGLGTFQMESKDSIVHAVEKEGYRHIDTAWVYNTEHLVGEALEEVFAKGVIKREDIFVVTKIHPRQFMEAEQTLKESLSRLKLDYVDCFLLHWPAQFQLPEKRVPLHVIWKQLEEFVDQGLIKSLGLSNFNVQLTADLLTYARHKPVINQVELHPFNCQVELVRFLLDHHILPVAYCPLGRPTPVEEESKPENLKYFKVPELRLDERVKEMAQKYNKSEFQVILRYGLDRGYGIIPKANKPEHQKQNIDIFDFHLSQEEIEYLNSKNINFRICNKFQFLKEYDIFA
eukprot:403344368